MDYSQKSLEAHKRLRGKISITLKEELTRPEQLSIYYTPGVGAVSSYVAAHPAETREYTWLNNSVAVVSDGSAVLGLGNIGPYGALPVMEGKSMLFKHFADIDAVPIVLDVNTADEIVAAVKAIAPSFGGINLEDIAAPVCFEVEERLKAELSIPVFHDDQHGTAVVCLAGLINAGLVSGKDLQKATFVVCGVGAAGVAIIKLIKLYAPGSRIYAIDSKGIISSNRTDLNNTKQSLINLQMIETDRDGDVAEAIAGSDVFIGVSQPGMLTADMIKTMNDRSVVFAMANPVPEIMPDEALAAGAAVVATGRSDFPNQVNNALVFPGIFRGALDNNIKTITDEHKLAAAKALAALVESPSADKIIPSVFDARIVAALANVVR